ncbi:MAG: hypothetical protein KJP21_04605 [Bacteroidia bacterium]|nr:hypothetical protein [Bacteroidia bacterium]
MEHKEKKPLSYTSPSGQKYNMKWDGRCWNLKRETKGYSKKQEKEIIAYTTTYHANISQCAEKIMHSETTHCDTLEQIISMFKESIAELTKHLNQ